MTSTQSGDSTGDRTIFNPEPTVLVVDDDVDFCASLVDILINRGYRAVPAGTCEEACFLLGELQPDVALVDMRLPDSSGLEVLAYAQQRSPHTGVVILTGYASLDSAVRALNLGAVAYLIKPCKADRLLLTVEKALARARSYPHPEEKSVPDSLLSAVPHPTLVFELDTGRLLYLNPAAEKLLSSQDAHLPKNLLYLLGGEVTEVVQSHIAEVRNCGQSKAELRLRLPGVGSCWYQLASARHPKSRRTGVTVLVDVTEYRQRQEQQRREHEYLEAIINNIPIPLAIISSDYRLQRVSPVFARFYGTSPTALVGRPCYTVIHQQSNPCRLHGEVCPIAACVATGTTARAMHQHQDGENRIRYIETTITPLRDEAGTTVAFIAMMVDYTDVKTAQQESDAKSAELARLNRELTEQQQQLEQQAAELSAANMELVRLSAAKDDFIATVSHELRTPLTAINESICLLCDGSLGEIDETKASLLKVAARNCSRLTELIDDLLDLAKLEANRMTTQPVVLDIGCLLTEAVDSFAVLARDRDVRLKLEPLTESLRAWADERHVRRILANLVGNAVKFTQHGTVTLSAVPSEDGVIVSVTDTGCGIPASEVDHIFEKFHQVNSSQGQRPSGTGLGLAITKRMVEMNGGRIWFETKEGVGTSFHFSLPVADDVIVSGESR